MFGLIVHVTILQESWPPQSLYFNPLALLLSARTICHYQSRDHLATTSRCYTRAPGMFAEQVTSTDPKLKVILLVPEATLLLCLSWSHQTLPYSEFIQLQLRALA